ncbi:putative coatomer subunit [Trichinella pseudospiralis]
MSTGRALHEEESGAGDMDQANGILPAENEEERESCARYYIVVGLCLGLFNKREAERKGKEPADTGTSANSEGRVSSLAEETDEPARGSGSFHWCDQLHRLIHLSEDLWHDLR